MTTSIIPFWRVFTSIVEQNFLGDSAERLHSVLSQGEHYFELKVFLWDGDKIAETVTCSVYDYFNYAENVKRYARFAYVLEHALHKRGIKLELPKHIK